MVIKKAVLKKRRVWQQYVASPEVNGCDCCKKEIKEYPNEPHRLDMTVWHKKYDSDTKHYHFCSWKCVFKFITKVKCEYFISLPHLLFDEGKTKKTASEFIELVKTITKTGKNK